jgi:6-phosphogluconate dehydrogenase
MAGRRWAGVPVTLESGKRIGGTPRKEIRVTLRHPHPCMCEAGRHYQNEIVFTLEPTDSIEIVFWAKRPGFESDVERRTFNFFLYEKTEKAQYVEEYARLLFDAIRGDQTLFVSTDEVRAMWAFIDPVFDAWHEGVVPLDTYEPDSEEAPRRASEVLARASARGSLGIVGLGKMGAGIARNAMDRGWRVVGFNRTTSVAEGMAAEGLVPATTFKGLVAALEPPRVVWLMVPAGKPVDEVLFGWDEHGDGLTDLLSPGDIVIDGGNSFFKDALERSSRLAERGIGFLDVGTSGGPEGARVGACLMIGGDAELFERLEPLFADVSVPDGYRFFEGVGAGHFVKMVHNGIEYGMMQAIAEGFQIMHMGPFDLNLGQVADVYQHGSVIESRLVGWLCEAFGLHGDALQDVSGIVGHTGEGEWTVTTAEELGLEARVIAEALRFRVESERNPTYAGQVLTALRNQFGGHGLGLERVF